VGRAPDRGGLNVARRTRAEAEATHEALLDAAEAVFFEKGVARASLQEIAERAGLSRGAVYWHFENKADLLHGLISRVHMPFEELAREIPEARRIPSPLEEIRQVCILAIQRLERPRYRRIHAILIHRCELFADIDPAAMLRELGQEAAEAMLLRFQAAERAGELRTGLDADTANWLLLVTLRGLVHTWHLDPDAFSIAEQGTRLIDRWFELIRAG